MFEKINSITNTGGLFYKKTKLPLSFSPEKTNVLFGIGLWSNSHGLSKGLPICILSMLLAANKIRNAVNAKDGKIFIMIADSLAEECNESDSLFSKEEITALRDQYAMLIRNLSKRLNIAEVHIEFSSDLTLNPQFNQILNQIPTLKNYKKNIENNESLSVSNKNYILKQLAQMYFYYLHNHCGIKISWTRSNTNISRGMASHDWDEARFDDYYTNVFNEHALGFVYTQPGTPLNTDAVSAVPYCYANSTETRILFGDSKETIEEKLSATNNKEKFESNTKKNRFLAIFSELLALRVNLSSCLKTPEMGNIIMDLSRICQLPSLAACLNSTLSEAQLAAKSLSTVLTETAPNEKNDEKGIEPENKVQDILKLNID